ncbi:hypothetical protein CSM81_23625 [Salmonella enterica subsp. enterica serovar Infantis]|nr:hypothetical protein [Salmonella enterica subsp. enterica serovar Infantis]
MLSLWFLTTGLLTYCSDALAGSTCYGSQGSYPVTLTLPDISLQSGSLPTPGTIFYRSQPVSIYYSCDNNGNAANITLFSSNIWGIADAFRNLGIKLHFLVRDSNEGTEHDWTPDAGGYKLLLSRYNGVSQRGTITVVLGLEATKEIGQPTRYVSPWTKVFSIAGSSIGSDPTGALGVNFSSFALQYLPTCLGRVELFPSYIDFGRVLTNGTRTFGSLPKQKPFSVIASVNRGCGTLPGHFAVKVNSTFMTSLPLTGDGKGIQLQNTDGNLNGLRLSLQQGGNDIPPNTPVSFGIMGDGSTTTSDGKLGVLRQQNDYMAVLEAIPGATIKTGAFSTDMVVKITYQ